jgi:hypothetical protein
MHNSEKKGVQVSGSTQKIVKERQKPRDKFTNGRKSRQDGKEKDK